MFGGGALFPDTVYTNQRRDSSVTIMLTLNIP